MIKNSDLIKKMTLEDKVNFITSNELYNSKKVVGFNFSRLEILDHIKKTGILDYVTEFPSYQALASTFNEELIKNVGFRYGIEAKANYDLAYLSVPIDLRKNNENNFSEDYFLTGISAKSFIEGLYESRCSISLDKQFTETDEVLAHNIDLKTLYYSLNNNIDSVLFHSVLDLKRAKEEFEFNKYCFLQTDIVEEAIKGIFLGADFIFTNNSDLNEGILKAIEQYKIDRETLDDSKLYDKKKNGLVLSIDDLDRACDNMIVFLSVLNDKKSYKRLEKITTINDDHKTLIDEVEHSKIAYEACKESIVLLKNNGILPLNYTKKVAVIGDLVDNLSYFKNTFKKTTKNITIIDAINLSTIDVSGYSYGYENEDTFVNAINLAMKSEAVILFLHPVDGKIPEEQLEIISELNKKNIKVIAVVYTDVAINLDFVDNCDACLLAYYQGQEFAKAIIDVLIGDVNPSGRLIETFDEINDSQAPKYYLNDNLKYPFGYGLSYTNFEYRNLKIKEKGITFILTNNGDYDGYAVCQMFVSSNLNKTKVLKGFSKRFVRKNESIKVFIPFDLMTFSSYSSNKEAYVISDDLYTVHVGNNILDIKLENSVHINYHLYKNDDFKNELVEENNFESDFFESKSKDEFYEEAKPVSFSMKLIISLVVLLYFDLLITLIGYNHYKSNEEMYVVVILAIIFGFINVGVFVFLFFARKNRQIVIKENVNDSLTLIVDKVKEFKEITHIEYKTPVKVEEVIEKEEIEETEIVEENIVYENLNRANKKEVNEIFNELNKYILDRGIRINKDNLRSFFSAVLAGKIVIVDTNNNDLLTKFLKEFSMFFSNRSFIMDAQNTNDIISMCYSNLKSNNSRTSFLEAIYYAIKEKDSLVMNSIINIDFLNNEMLQKIIKYAKHSKEKNSIEIKKFNETVEIKNNVVFILNFKDIKEIDENLARCSFYVNLDLYEENELEVNLDSVISYSDILESINQNINKYFISEDNWKKLDELEIRIEGFKIGNRETLLMENYSSINLSLDNDEQSVIDSMILSKLVNVFKKIDEYKKDNGKTIIELLDNIFNEEEINNVKKALRG